MHELNVDSNESHTPTYAGHAFSQRIPKFSLPPEGLGADAAYQLVHDELNLDGNPALNFLRGQSQTVPLTGLGGRTAAVMVVPYPPGIPLLMAGEAAGELDQPVIGYLQALEAFDKHFPGFENDVHGVERAANGDFLIECLSEPVRLLPATVALAALIPVGVS